MTGWRCCLCRGPGTNVNGRRVQTADLRHGGETCGGLTVMPELGGTPTADLVPDEDVPGASRVAVLLCGELFSWRARRSIAGLKADLVVDLGHSGMGQGLIPAMRNLATTAISPVAHTQHLAGWWGSVHFVNGKGEQHSVEVTQERAGGAATVEVSILVLLDLPLSRRRRHRLVALLPVSILVLLDLPLSPPSYRPAHESR